jgi:hypothetical protein
LTNAAQRHGSSGAHRAVRPRPSLVHNVHLPCSCPQGARPPSCTSVRPGYTCTLRGLRCGIAGMRCTTNSWRQSWTWAFCWSRNGLPPAVKWGCGEPAEPDPTCSGVGHGGKTPLAPWPEIGTVYRPQPFRRALKAGMVAQAMRRARIVSSQQCTSGLVQGTASHVRDIHMRRPVSGPDSCLHEHAVMGHAANLPGCLGRHHSVRHGVPGWTFNPGRPRATLLRTAVASATLSPVHAPDREAPRLLNGFLRNAGKRGQVVGSSAQQQRTDPAEVPGTPCAGLENPPCTLR